MTREAKAIAQLHVSARTYLAVINLLYLFKDRVAIVDLLIRVVEIIGDPTAALFWITLNYRIIRDDHPDVYYSVNLALHSCK
jgi:hypothetical protein